MALFPFFKKKRLLTEAEEAQVVEAIRGAEKQTSGEVRVYVESHCRFVDPVDRAIEVFFGLKMNETDNHNAVLVYVALKDRQLAIYGDEGIHAKVGRQYWLDTVRQMLTYFNKHDYIAGLCTTITTIGQTLQKEFPYQRDDKNELPDAIVFGS